MCPSFWYAFYKRLLRLCLFNSCLGNELYIGCSNGSLLRYAFIDNLGDSVRFLHMTSFKTLLMLPLKLESYQLLTHQSLPSSKPIEQIYIAASVEQVLVLSGIYSLVSFLDEYLISSSPNRQSSSFPFLPKPRVLH